MCYYFFFKVPRLLKVLAKMRLDNYNTWGQKNLIFSLMKLCISNLMEWLWNHFLDFTLANSSFVFHEKQWLKNCPIKFTTVYYEHYVDGSFILFKSSEHLLHFRNYLKLKHPNIPFSLKSESNNKIFLLDAEVYRENGRFTTTVHRKPTFSSVYIHIDSFKPTTYKFSMI